MGRIKILLGNIALIAGGFLVSLILIEGFLNVWNPFESRVQGNKIILPVYRKYEIRKENQEDADLVLHTKNELGFRGPGWPENPDDVLKFVFVGGSTTEEFYQADGETWPERVMQKLSGDIPDLWVNNAGLDGHSSFGHIVLMRDFIADLGPDAVFFLVGINDVGKEVAVSYDTRLKPDWLEDPSFSDLDRWLKENTEVGKLVEMINRKLKAKQFQRFYGHIEVASLNEAGADSLPGLNDALEQRLAEHRRDFIPGFRSRLETLVEMSRQSGIEPVFLTQPVLFAPVLDEDSGVDLGKVIYGGMTGAGQYALMELYNDVTRSVAGENNVLLFDLARDMPHRSSFYSDMMHYTDRGDQAVSTIVAGYIRDHLEVLQKDK